MSDELKVCTPVWLPYASSVDAASRAVLINPLNHPLIGPESGPLRQRLDRAHAERIVFLTTKYWGSDGVNLTVGFMESAPSELQARILTHMNAWGKRANIKFRLSSIDPQVRISRGSGGYWSYLGTDILSVPMGQQTMNLEGFTMNTPDSEFYRVVRHETGHTLGAPHEHERAAEVAKLDRDKTIALFHATQGWSTQMIVEQILTPLSEDDFLFSSPADEKSIMTYQFPGSITKDGQPIVGGLDINENDYDAVGLIYPIQVA